MDIFVIILLLVLLIHIAPVTPFHSNNSQYLSLDTSKCWKGWLALFILFHHLAKSTDEGLFFKILQEIGHLPVAGFFFFSGYGVMKSYMRKKESYLKSFASKRIPVILIPYITAIVIYWGFFYINGTHYSLTDVLLSLISGYPIVTYSWYIINILLFYLLFFLLANIFKTNYPLIIIFTGIFYVLYVFLCRKAGYGAWWYNNTPLLIIGMIWAVSEPRTTKILDQKFFLAPLSWVLLFVTILIKIQVSINGLNYIIILVSSISFVFALLTFSMKFKIGNSILSFLGNISLEIYLIQGIFIETFKDWANNRQKNTLFALLIIVLTIFSSFLLHHFNRLLLNAISLKNKTNK